MTTWRWLLAPLALAIAACSAETVDTDARVRAARIQTVSAADAPVRRDFVGRVEARLTVDLAFQVGGRLADFPISEGEILEEGALVARLETQDFERARREAQVQLQQATQNLERVRTLHERGIASDAALEEAQTAHDLRAVALDNARQNLEYATVEAPFEGLVARRLVDNFTTVAPGQPIARLQDVSELRVAISVPESLIATIDQDAARVVEARFPFLPGQTFPLEYRELIAEPDQASQTYRVIFALPDDIPANVLPGMTVSVSVTIDPSGDPALAGVRAPVSALAATAEGGFRVWVYDPVTGEVSSRAVTTGAVSGDSVLVAEGLTPGERIVTAGVNALHEGMRVRPLETTARYGGEG